MEQSNFCRRTNKDWLANLTPVRTNINIIILWASILTFILSYVLSVITHKNTTKTKYSGNIQFFLRVRIRIAMEMMIAQIEIANFMRISLVASAAMSTKSKSSSNPKSTSSDSQLDVNLQ